VRPFADAEELHADFIPATERRRGGIFLTPRWLVDLIVDRVATRVPTSSGPLRILDPACGAGAFLAGALRRFPRAQLLGLELSLELAARARARLPKADIRTGDALRGGLEQFFRENDGFELWLGNPPYNGTSPTLADKTVYARLQRLLPAQHALPRGTSLRDDYAFFLLLAAARLRERPGALAFVTSATLLDAYLYSPVRRALLEGLTLCEVIDLGGGVFANTRVKTCVTVWSSPRRKGRPRYRAGPEDAGLLFEPEGEERLLRPAPREAAALDASWRARGEPLTRLVPVSFPGLKTRFDELLVDVDRDVLLTRVESFLKTDNLPRFAREHGIESSLLPKLEALKASLPSKLEADPRAVRLFFRYAGARHRGDLPDSARAWCYLDRRLIPRGDHRLRGRYDPHLEPVKLIFNVRELPLAAALVTEAGCVHDHRHARFAPLYVPTSLRDREPGAPSPLDPGGAPVLNLSVRGQAWARQLGGPRQAFRALVDFINSEEVQRIWAPAYGASRELPVPLEP
jgi:hypothetical protein